ncbi:alcohol dehydrogenase [ADH] [Thermoplasma volcanium GSS1]|uniref:Alcohol dehydrogenase [ADH] n=1 Tax=Thermoplasma volcanium (strain ATCC 51530 / DSM 4299 / JCM 9571 / NBRC 15438 / GSS1) TaxID=273116 RepID=Q97C38_THEVO|nr:alcohol dehydrogenase catalytic domain-containing protein [Thermoplasma volcanium]BAB59409.1 alcohol dehydrogenase [ADH] [Thermoplasma volcanium GSS1]
MKAVFVYEPLGNENVKVEEVSEPKKEQGKVIIEVKKAGLNPIDYNVINGKIVYRLNPLPHIPGSEVYGIVKEDSGSFKKGERVIVYNRIFDGTCSQCISGNEHLCENGGIWGVVSNGGYSQLVQIDEKNVFRVPEDASDELAASIGVAALTSFRAIRISGCSPGRSILIYGASGNTGMFAVQLASMMGCDVYAVSRKDWIESFGAIEVFRPDNIPPDMKFDIIINPLGSLFWGDALKHLRTRGILVSFGVLTGREGSIDIADLYTGEKKILGSTGGTREDLRGLLEFMKTHELRVKIAREFKINEIKDALKYYSETHDGRILISMRES